MLLRCWKTTGKHARFNSRKPFVCKATFFPLCGSFSSLCCDELLSAEPAQTRSSSFTVWMFTACKTQTAFTGSPKLCLMQTTASSRSGSASSCALEGFWSLKHVFYSELQQMRTLRIDVEMKEEGRCKRSAYKRTAGWILCKCKTCGGVFWDWESTLIGLSVLYMLYIRKVKK